ncbi:MAG: phytanoyl-CoA dioxygenase family protein [Calditrichales bacterium]|nr:MAG: phytanoyl-CoA dioxygenase family protein [Calditrichales bacterium]
MSVIAALDDTYQISNQQIAQYQRDGFILLRQVCTKEELESYRRAITALVEAYAAKRQALSERDTYGKAFLQIGGLWQRDQLVRKFVLAKRFSAIAAALSQSPAMRLYNDQALYKERGGGLTPWHQDHYYWPLDTRQAITMWMPMVDASEEMGTMSFAAGSHKHGHLKPIHISDASEDYFNNYLAEQGFNIYNSGDLKAGDATFHNGWTLHRAGPNLTDRMREVMTVIYYPDGTRLLQPEYEHRQIDFDFFFKGMKPGDLAANEGTPVVYTGRNGLREKRE